MSKLNPDPKPQPQTLTLYPDPDSKPKPKSTSYFLTRYQTHLLCTTLQCQGPSMQPLVIMCSCDKLSDFLCLWEIPSSWVWTMMPPSFTLNPNLKSAVCSTVLGTIIFQVFWNLVYFLVFLLYLNQVKKIANLNTFLNLYANINNSVYLKN